MEKSPATVTYHLGPVLLEPCGIIMFLTFLTWSISKIQGRHPDSSQSCRSPADKATSTPVLVDRELTKKRNKIEDDDMELTHEDITTVMGNLGLGFDQEKCMVCSSPGSYCISRLFDDDEPSLQEVSEAFLVFDDDNDGYIDALDLQRVLRSLGLHEGVGLDECEQMIARYDMNKDRRLDMLEFTKVLEASIC